MISPEGYVFYSNQISQVAQPAIPQHRCRDISIYDISWVYSFSEHESLDIQKEFRSIVSATC